MPDQPDSTCPALPEKIFLFRPDPNHRLIRSRPASLEGRIAIVTDVEAGCGGRGWADDERPRRGRPSRVVLTPRRWRQVGGVYSAGDGGKKARSPGRVRISRKTIACGNVGRSRRPRCEYSCAFLLPHLHTRLRVRRAPGIPARPLSEGEHRSCTTRATPAAGSRICVVILKVLAVFGEPRRTEPAAPFEAFAAQRHLKVTAPNRLSYGLPFAGPIFYGAGGFAARERDNHNIIKGLAVSLCLWRAV
jgi:hypothetical protein